MTEAVSFVRKYRRRPTRLFKVGSARSALADFGRGDEVTCYTFGQFSILDALVALLHKTGPADVVVATWTAAAADLRRASELMRDDRIRSCRWIVDLSFKNRQPEYLELMRELFGPDSIRALKTHAKFMLIRNDDWNLVIRTSMNLNENKRLENLDVVDDRELSDWHWSLVEGVFRDRAVDAWVDHDDLDLSGVAATEPEGQVDMGRVSFGRVYERGVAHVGPVRPS